MIYRRLDNNGDYSFGRGRQDFMSGAAAVGQAVKTRLLLLSGEWWEDRSDGTPLFQSILGTPGTPDNLSAVDLLIQERITSTEGVTQILEYTNDYENRACSVKCIVGTIYGQAALEEVIS